MTDNMLKIPETTFENVLRKNQQVLSGFDPACDTYSEYHACCARVWEDLFGVTFASSLRGWPGVGDELMKSFILQEKPVLFALRTGHRIGFILTGILVRQKDERKRLPDIVVSSFQEYNHERG